eukprot:2025080-Prymnesium_polylepis.1
MRRLLPQPGGPWSSAAPPPPPSSTARTRPTMSSSPESDITDLPVQTWTGHWRVSVTLHGKYVSTVSGPGADTD